MARNQAPVRGKELRAGYGDHAVLGPLSFELKACCTGVVLGPGGMGKSTLLRVLRGAPADPPDLWSRGRLHLPPGPVSHLAQKPRPGSGTLGDGLREAVPTGDPAGVLATAWSAVPGAAAALAAVLEEPLSSLPLEPLRLAELTLALAREESLVLLDEPDLDLDDPWLGWVTDRLVALRGKRTILMATHNLQLARRVSDYALLLIDGVIVESGPTDQLFERPAQERTRRYVRMGS